MIQMKRLIKNLLGRAGYEVRRIGDSPEFAAIKNVPDKDLYSLWSPLYPLYTPWMRDLNFVAKYDRAKTRTLVSPDRCYILTALARHCVHLKGDFAECGVYRGGTALMLADELQGSGKILHLFDSFQGLPEANVKHDRFWGRGDFANPSIEDVEQLLAPFQGFINLRVGWIPQTFVGLEEKHYALVHVDVDLYQTALDCCQYFYMRLVAGGVMIFDDYGFPACRGEKVAVDEFFADKREKPIALPTGQAMVLKI